MKKEPPPRTNKPCKFWAEKGTCFKGDACPFAHVGTPPVREPPEATLLVRDVPPGVSKDVVKSYFTKYGPVASVKFFAPPRVRDALVEFQKAKHAESAHLAVNYIGDKKVKTDYWRKDDEAKAAKDGDRLQQQP